MVLGNKANIDINRFGNKSTGSNSLGSKKRSKRNSSSHEKHHTVGETRTVSHDQGPGFMNMNHKHKDNTQSVHNDLERYRAPKKDKQVVNQAFS